MPGPMATVIWLVGTALELAFVVCSVARNSFFKYFFLNLYILAVLTSSIGRCVFLQTFGQSSEQYRYIYFYTDALLTLALYIALISLYTRVFGALGIGKYVRLISVLLLLGTSLFSYAVVAQSEDLLVINFA